MQKSALRPKPQSSFTYIHYLVTCGVLLLVGYSFFLYASSRVWVPLVIAALLFLVLVVLLFLPRPVKK